MTRTLRDMLGAAALGLAGIAAIAVLGDRVPSPLAAVLAIAIVALAPLLDVRWRPPGPKGSTCNRDVQP